MRAAGCTYLGGSSTAGAVGLLACGLGRGLHGVLIPRQTMRDGERWERDSLISVAAWG